jgi:hypothetical protein
MICNQFSNDGTIVQTGNCYWTNCYESKMDNLICQHMVWHPLLGVPDQGQTCSSLHNEGHVLGYLCELCA